MTLQDAAKAGNVQALRALLAAGADVNRTDSGGSTALHLAARHGRTDAVIECLALGANVVTKDNCGYTPLHRATEGGHTGTVAALLTHGADVGGRRTTGAHGTTDARRGRGCCTTLPAPVTPAPPWHY